MTASRTRDSGWPHGWVRCTLYSDSRRASACTAVWLPRFSSPVGRSRPQSLNMRGTWPRRRKSGCSRISRRCCWRAKSNIFPSRVPGGGSGMARRWCRPPREGASRISCTSRPPAIPSAGARTGPSRCVFVIQAGAPRNEGRLRDFYGTGPWPWPLPCLHNRGTISCPVPARPCHILSTSSGRVCLPPPCDNVPGQHIGADRGPSWAVPPPSAARSEPSPVPCSSVRMTRRS